MSELPHEPSPNPYEPPHTIAEADASLLPPQKVSTTTIFLVSAALLLGVISIAPAIGLFFLVCSVPVFVRFAKQGKRSEQPTARTAVIVTARALASVGVALSVFAAALGAFFGTCHATGFVTILTFDGRSDSAFGFAIFLAPLAGVIAAIFTTIKLWPLTSVTSSLGSHMPGEAQPFQAETTQAPTSDNNSRNAFADPPDEKPA